MFLIRQRYKFETNSQPSRYGKEFKYHCFWYVKDTNLKPIHNDRDRGHARGAIVSDTSKIQIWNQFTTFVYLFLYYYYCFWYVKDTNLKPIHNGWQPILIKLLLFLIRQRYKFETNSQLWLAIALNVLNCFWYVKDTNLKPIHNAPSCTICTSDIVSDTSKIQIWNQFTTLNVMITLLGNCFWYVKDTNLKPIHNALILCFFRPFIVSDTSKIQIWNQFTTIGSKENQMYHCFWYVKDTNLKPIHNLERGLSSFLKIVSDTSKIQIWNQFTTRGIKVFRQAVLFLIRQRYKFETNSQLVCASWFNGIYCFWYVKDTNLKPIHN